MRPQVRIISTKTPFLVSPRRSASNCRDELVTPFQRMQCIQRNGTRNHVSHSLKRREERPLLGRLKRMVRDRVRVRVMVDVYIRVMVTVGVRITVG